MKDLIKKIDKLGDDVERLQSLQTGSGGGGVSTASLPLAITGSNMAITATTTNDGGTIVKQATTPGTAQTGNINISGKLTAGSANLTGNMTSGSVSTGTATGSSFAATGTVSGNFLQSSGNIQAISGPYFLGSIPILDRGGTFPSSGLLDGQRYWNTVYRSWFVYNLTDLKWRQEAPGVFSGSFPTIAAGDNTVAPQIEVKRIDRSNEVYFWNGANWLTVKNYPVSLSAKLGVSATFTLSASTSAVNQGPHPDGTSDVYITNIVANLFPNGTNNGSNYWIAQFRTRTSAAAASNTYTGNTSAGTTSTIIPVNITVNAVVTRANFFDIVQDVNTSGTPGTVNFFPAIVNCRLVG